METVWSCWKVGGPHVDKLLVKLKTNASRADRYRFIVASPTLNLVVLGIRVDSVLHTGRVSGVMFYRWWNGPS